MIREQKVEQNVPFAKEQNIGSTIDTIYYVVSFSIELNDFSIA